MDGGGQPRWRQDGKELFYVGLDGSLLSVTIDVSAERAIPSAPQKLFQTRLPAVSIMGQQYDIMPDGQRFVVTTPVRPAAWGDQPAVVILNWQPLSR